MPHEFDDLIADLNAAKADLARSVKRARKMIDARRSAALDAAEDKSVFNWSDDDLR
jgi:hypothetical protein